MFAGIEMHLQQMMYELAESYVSNFRLQELLAFPSNPPPPPPPPHPYSFPLPVLNGFIIYIHSVEYIRPVLRAPLLND